MKAVSAVMALAAGVVAGQACAADGDVCAQPTEIQGFKTCADVAKAEAEGEVVVYATNPEAAELRVLA
jgi:iron(III) transport system substrate-binding protein